jgi:tetratricopeptide (TPR) repeat protein
VIALLAAYSVVGHRTVLDKRPQGNKLAAGVALLITIGYGIFFAQVDRAQIQYQRSLGGGDDAIQSAKNADAIDPNLNLYTLQIAHLRGEQAIDNPSEGNIQLAIDAYQTALEREPTWDTGWINLAALTARTGDLATALDYLQTARAINPLTIVPLDIARIADEAEIGEDDDIIADYITGMRRTLFDDNRLPLSTFWTETPLRREALTQYAESLPVDLQYRIWRVHDPERLVSLVPQSPQTADEYWVAGEHALTVANDTDSAATFFSQAIKRDKRNGDYYAARARATLTSDPDMAQRDLDLAELLGTRFEYPNVTRIEFAQSQDEIDTLLARALPGRTIKQEFAAVLYGGRAADFDLFPEMRAPGPGRDAMQPWYTLARQHTLNGRIDSARNVYNVILDYAPDETEARELLNALDD